jgi:hypothetical protein
MSKSGPRAQTFDEDSNLKKLNFLTSLLRSQKIDISFKDPEVSYFLYGETHIPLRAALPEKRGDRERESDVMGLKFFLTHDEERKIEHDREVVSSGNSTAFTIRRFLERRK